ncbi:MAG: TRAP transporter small permease, partial [Desulfobacteraceae bacterium]|nr:TRAP transporter small permease [Desulfobacteraceae bacterium]
MSRFTAFKNITRRLTNYSLAIGMGWVLVMMLLTTFDIAGRYFFSKPIPGTIELSEFMLAIFGIMG